MFNLKSCTLDNLQTTFDKANSYLVQLEKDLYSLNNKKYEELKVIKKKRFKVRSEILEPLQDFNLEDAELKQKVLYNNAYQKVSYRDAFSDTATLEDRVAILSGFTDAYNKSLSESGSLPRSVTLKNFDNNKLSAITFSAIAQAQPELELQFKAIKVKEKEVREELHDIKELKHITKRMLDAKTPHYLS